MEKFFIIIALASLGFTSCVKEKTPVVVVDCPTTISFAADVLPVIQAKCVGCHAPGGSAAFLNLSDHTAISNAANQGSFIGRMKGQGGQLMPIGGPAIHDSIIKKIECWVSQGKLNN